MAQRITGRCLERHLGDTVTIKRKFFPDSLRLSEITGRLDSTRRWGEAPVGTNGSLYVAYPTIFCKPEGGSGWIETVTALRPGEIIKIHYQPRYIQGIGYEEKKEKVIPYRVDLQ